MGHEPFLNILNRLQRLLILQSRFAEAELLARSKFKYEKNSYLKYPALTVGVFANALYVQNRYDDAAFIAKTTIGLHYRKCSEPDSIPAMEAWRILLMSLSAQNKWAEIQVELEFLKRDLNTLPGRFEELFGKNPDILIARALEKNDGELLAELNRALNSKTTVSSFNGIFNSLGLDESETANNTASRDVLELRLIRGLALQQAGRNAEAFADYHKVNKPYLYETLTQRSSTKSGGGPSRANFFRQSYMESLTSPDGQHAAKAANINVAAELFQIATMIPSGKVQGSFLASASRAAAQDPELATLVRQAQDLDEQARDTADVLAYLQTAPSEQVERATLDDLRQRVPDLNNAKLTLEKEINSRFPAYADLMHPRTPRCSLAGAQSRGDHVTIRYGTAGASLQCYLNGRAPPFRRVW